MCACVTEKIQTCAHVLLKRCTNMRKFGCGYFAGAFMVKSYALCFY